MKEDIHVSISRQEALVLYEWLASSEHKLKSLTDEPEQKILRRVEGQLEKQLTEVVALNYSDLVANAKNNIRNNGVE